MHRGRTPVEPAVLGVEAQPRNRPAGKPPETNRAFDLGGFELFFKFEAGFEKADRAHNFDKRIVRQDVRLTALCRHLRKNLFRDLPAVFRRGTVNLSTHQLAQQEISGERRRDHVERDDVVFQPGLCAASGDKAGLIRVIVVDVDNSVVTAFEDVCDLELEVAALVATEGKAGRVVAFHKHAVRNRHTFVYQRLA